MASTHGTSGDQSRQPLLPLPRVLPLIKEQPLTPPRSSIIQWNDFILMQICPEAKNFLHPSTRSIIRMRGLPFQANIDNIVEFFSEGTNGARVCSDGGVLILKKPDGKATGDAFVMFENPLEAELAMSKQKNMMGKRYIELFSSSSTEVAQFLTRTLRSLIPDTKKLHEEFSKEKGSQTLGNIYDCLRLKGFALGVEVRDILSFLGSNCSRVVNHGIHLIYTPMGDPTGEALVRMHTQADALEAYHQLKDQKWILPNDQEVTIEVGLCNTDGLQVFAGKVRPSYIQQVDNRDLDNQHLALLQSAALHQTLPFVPLADSIAQLGYITGVGVGNGNPDTTGLLNGNFASLPFDANLFQKIHLQQGSLPEFCHPVPFEPTSLPPNFYLLPQAVMDLSKKRTFFEAFPSLDLQKHKNVCLASIN